MNALSYPIIILGGGLATRIRPLTTHLPKFLVEIHGEPFIAHQLRLLKKSGAQRVILSLHYLGEMVVDYVGDGRRFGLHVEYSFDGPNLLGTAGAIKQALPLLGETFFVLYGDSYLPCDYTAVQQAFISSQSLGLMTVFRNHGQFDKSNVEFLDGQIIAYDKQLPTSRMDYIDYGLGVLTKKAFDYAPCQQPYDLASLYQTLLKNQQLAAFEVFERFYEVGSFTGIDELKYYLAHTTCLT